uniref:Erythromycin esterase n=1 Tax=Coccidioides posadasii RMSCC 3488 TaxID=454284 RepID=A0A0J6FS68_COCPO|nr:hypothetical protein CPAG_09502 [Coccidioides posadasii RMSCC 3488]
MPVTRRSARLRGETPVFELSHVERKPSRSAAKLPSLTEGNDEALTSQTKPTCPTTPTKSMACTPVKNYSSSKPSIKTPGSASPPKPALEEMHPSKVQQSTSKQPDSALVLGFRPVQMDPNAPGNTLLTLSNTPSKGRLSHPDQLEALSYDFKFTCENSEFGAEAREIMKSVREDAARIKAEMILKAKDQNLDGEKAKPLEDRKIATAKGKIGRFSEIHMAQFRKMDSIANHPSSFRARPDRVQPPVSKGLKRTISKAQLDAPEKATPTGVNPVTTTGASANSVTKRFRSKDNEDTSTRRPLFKDDQVVNRGLKTGPTVSKDLSTPRKPTTACSTGVKHPQTTKIPSLSYSPSKSSLAPRTPQTDLNPKAKKTTPGFGALKSILCRRQPLFSNDPVKIAAGTHQAFPDADLGSKLVSAPDTSEQSHAVPSSKKRVGFSDSTKLPDVSPETPRTPDFGPIAEGASDGYITYPTLPPLSTPQANKQYSFFFEPSPVSARKGATMPSSQQMPTFSTPGAIPHGIANKKRQREDAENRGQGNRASPNYLKDGQRSAKRVKTSLASPSKTYTPSPVKKRLTQHTTPRSAVRTTPSSTQHRTGLSLSRLSFLARPKQRR